MLETHPLADLFPAMDAEAFQRLQADIRSHGLQDPVIWLYEGKILDGRHRYRVCLDLDLSYETPTYTGPDPVAFVMSQNLHRRHLTESQRAMVGARIATLRHGQRPPEASPVVGAVPAEGSEPPMDDAPETVAPVPLSALPPWEPRVPTPMKQQHAARLLNVGARTIRLAKTVLDKGAPDVIAAVDAGALPVKVAAKLVEHPGAVQQQVMDRVKVVGTVGAAMRVAIPRPPRDIEPDLAALRRLCDQLWTHWGTTPQAAKVATQLRGQATRFAPERLKAKPKAR